MIIIMQNRAQMKESKRAKADTALAVSMVSLTCNKMLGKETHFATRFTGVKQLVTYLLTHFIDRKQKRSCAISTLSVAIFCHVNYPLFDCYHTKRRTVQNPNRTKTKYQSVQQIKLNSRPKFLKDLRRTEWQTYKARTEPHTVPTLTRIQRCTELNFTQLRIQPNA